MPRQPDGLNEDLKDVKRQDLRRRRLGKVRICLVPVEILDIDGDKNCCKGGGPLEELVNELSRLAVDRVLMPMNLLVAGCGLDFMSS